MLVLGEDFLYNSSFFFSFFLLCKMYIYNTEIDLIDYLYVPAIKVVFVDDTTYGAAVFSLCIFAEIKHSGDLILHAF